jgi:regulator of Ty1 transposition protein 109
MNLRDTLLASLTSLPGTREFHLHVLVSSPRKCSSLFPFANPRPRTYLQDILILLSEQATPDAPHLFVTAIEASIYNTSRSPTATLAKTLITYYADPVTRPINAEHLWIHLFARAQGQYLFPNSSEFAGKRPLSDIQLCSWWKRILGGVAREVDIRTKSKGTVRLYYVLPGYSEEEATRSLNFASTSIASSSTSPLHQWIYGHPYSQSDIPLPCPSNAEDDIPLNLGQFIPSFEDDPKNRFMDEIAYTTEGEGVKSPQRKRSRTTSGPSVLPTSDVDSKKDDRTRAPGDLEKVTPDEFWERMSFRQECIAGAVTGFFVMGVSSTSLQKDMYESSISPLEPQPGQVSSQLIKRVMTSLLTGHEFSTLERSIRATEGLESSIKGLCDGLAPIPAKPISTSRPRDARRTPEPELKPQATLAPPSTPPRRPVNGKYPIPDISPNPFPEPVTSLETYHSHIYSSISVSNPQESSRAQNGGAQSTGGKVASTPAVTVLTVRKKKKRTLES